MFKSALPRLAASLAAAAVLAAAIPGTVANAASTCGKSNERPRTLEVVGLTSDQRLVCFNEFKPRGGRNIGAVTGLSGSDTALVGIDFRVQDGKLYGVGNGGGVYLLDVSTAAATFVNGLSMPLSGTSFGVDFNPAADRLRIISDNGQNLRHNVNVGGVTLLDGVLTYTAPPATAVATLGVTGAAYTNNDLDANTATTLYDLDTALDQVSIQSPANNGILVATGKLLLDAGVNAGFDIHSKLLNGVTVDVTALAAIATPDGRISLYSVKLPTGKASLRGRFSDNHPVTDIAIPLNQL